MGRREGAFEEGVEETIVVAEDKRSWFNNFRSLLKSVVTLIGTEYESTYVPLYRFYELCLLHFSVSA